MKYSTRFSDAIHIVVFIAAGGSDGDLSSAAIAKSLNKKSDPGPPNYGSA